MDFSDPQKMVAGLQISVVVTGRPETLKCLKVLNLEILFPTYT